MRWADVITEAVANNMPVAARKLARELKRAWRNHDADADDEEATHLQAQSEALDSLTFDANQRVLMYRAMVVDAAFVKQLMQGTVTELGYHWASHRGAAVVYSHAGSRVNQYEIVLCVSVDFTHLNWDMIVDRVEVGESELLAYAESPLKLEAAWLDGRALSLPSALPTMHP
jgi:hypothetical protein